VAGIVVDVDGVDALIAQLRQVKARVEALRIGRQGRRRHGGGGDQGDESECGGLHLEGPFCWLNSREIGARPPPRKRRNPALQRLKSASETRELRSGRRRDEAPLARPKASWFPCRNQRPHRRAGGLRERN